MITNTNIELNKIVAKNNFKWKYSDELQMAINEGFLENGFGGVVDSYEDAKSYFRVNGTGQIDQGVVGEATAFLAEGEAVSVRLIQFSCYGSLFFRYVVKIRNI